MAEYLKKFMESLNSDDTDSNKKDGDAEDGADSGRSGTGSSWSWGAKNRSKNKKEEGVEAVKEKEGQADESKWNSFLSNLMSNKDDNHDGNNDAVGNVLNYVIQSNDSEQGEVSEGNSVKNLFALIDLYGGELKRTGEKFFGEIEMTNLIPPSLFYYLEKEEEHKTPSWKCRKHRFYPKLKVDDVIELNTYFHYADLAYNTDRDQIKDELDKAPHGGEPYDLIHFKGDSQPHEPGYFVAVKRGTADKKDKCEILLSIRGTASIEDVITDVLCESVEYSDKGRAHSGILKSGQYVVEEFQSVLEKFIKDCNIKGKIEILVVGHSLGGGAACIVGMELQGIKHLNVRVVGFGTPGCISKELGEQADYITTVVCDSDAIPRTSGENVVNAILNIMEHDWIDKAKLDAELVLKDIQKDHSWFVSDSIRDNTLERINKLLDEQARSKVKQKTTKRMEPILFPPGECIHLWRDGSGISGNVVPGSFFDELDISRTMVDDHLSKTGYGGIFLQLMRQHHDDPHLRFESLLKKKEEKEKKGQSFLDFAGWKW